MTSDESSPKNGGPTASASFDSDDFGDVDEFLDTAIAESSSGGKDGDIAAAQHRTRKEQADDDDNVPPMPHLSVTRNKDEKRYRHTAVSGRSTKDADHVGENEASSASNSPVVAATAVHSAPSSPVSNHGPGRNLSRVSAKMSPKSPKSPGTRRIGIPGRNRKKYDSVNASHSIDDLDGDIDSGGENDDERKISPFAQHEEMAADIDAIAEELTIDTTNTAENDQPVTTNGTSPPTPDHLGNISYPNAEEERRIVESFWRLYDDHVILSIFGILGILFRILASSWFRIFDDTFNENSSLFTNLPLNCLSCFIMGVLCSGEDALKILYTRAPGFRKIDHKKNDAATAHSMVSPSSTSFAGSENDADEYESRGVRPIGSNSFQENEQNGDDYASRGGRSMGSNHIVDEPVPTRRRRQTMQRIRAGGRTMVLEILTGGTPAAGDVDPDEQLREVQLMAFERRIRESGCIVLFPGKKQDTDVLNHYFDSSEQYYHDDRSSILSPTSGSIAEAAASFDSMNNREDDPTRQSSTAPTGSITQTNGNSDSGPHADSGNTTTTENDEGLGIDRMVYEVTENITRLTQVDIAEGWDVGTTPEAMSEDLLLGLRVGFCGCLSTFSSWNSSMINLLWNGHITQALAGYAIGLQLPIISYRAGQHAAVYWFVWRRRREVKRDERRGGYGLRLRGEDDDSEDEDDESIPQMDSFHDEYDEESNFDNGLSSPESAHGSPDGAQDPRTRRRKKQRKGGRILVDDAATNRKTPSIRAIATAIFLLIFVLLVNSLFFLDDTQTSISLLFSPLGVLTRWRLLRLNKLRAGFPLGTFACNMLGCALSGSLGSLLAGNPGPEESLVVQSMIQGYAGSLSSLAAFVVEILDLIDPIIFKYDGLRYAVLTLAWALAIGFVSSQTKDIWDKV